MPHAVYRLTIYTDALCAEQSLLLSETELRKTLLSLTNQNNSSVNVACNNLEKFGSWGMSHGDDFPIYLITRKEGVSET